MTEKQRSMAADVCFGLAVVAGIVMIGVFFTFIVAGSVTLHESMGYWPAFIAVVAFAVMGLGLMATCFIDAGRPEPPPQRNWAHELWDLADDVVSEYEGDGGSISRLAELVKDYDENER